LERTTLLTVLVLFVLAAYFVYGMVTWNVVISFTDWKGAIPSYNFVGLSNYSAVIKSDLFGRSLLNTFILFSAIPLCLAAGLFLAFLLNQRVKGIKIFTIIFLLPFAFSLVVTGVIWSWMFQPDGAINSLLRSIRLGFFARDWISSSAILASVLIPIIWQFSGYSALVLLAGLKSVPRKEIEKARKKGMNWWQIFWKVEFPRLRIPLLSCAVVIFVFVLKASFDLLWTMARGYPPGSYYTLPILVYVEAYQKMNVAYGAVIGNILVGIVLAIVLPYVWFSYRGHR